MRRHFKISFVFFMLILSVSAQEELEFNIPEPQPSSGPDVLANQDPNASRTREIFAVKDIPQTIQFEYDIGEIAIGNPSIAAVVVDRPRRRIVVTPLQIGETALLVFDSRGQQRDNVSISVTSTDLDQFVKDLKFLFRDIEGLAFRRVGRKVVVEGQVYVKADLDRIQEVLKNNNFTVNLVTLSQDTQRILARKIKDEINISGVRVDAVRDKLILRGEVVSEDLKKQAELIASVFIQQNRIVNAISVNKDRQSARSARLIQVSAYFVELNKSFLRNFNFSWTPIADVNFTYFNQDGSGGLSFTSVVTEFLPKLNTAKALGVARVFENPTVSVKSGDRASINSGISLIIPSAVNSLTSGGVATSEPIQTGIQLNVTPTADDRDFIDIKLDVRASSLGSSPKGSSVPGGQSSSVLINESSVDTSHFVRSGETVAIGGVLRSAFTDVKDAPPGQPFSFQAPGAQGVSVTSGFGNVFQIFKSRAVSSDRTMFIVFITPEILNSARDSSRKLRDTMNLQRLEALSAEDAEED